MNIILNDDLVLYPGAFSGNILHVGNRRNELILLRIMILCIKQKVFVSVVQYGLTLIL